MVYFADILYHYMSFHNPDSHVFYKLQIFLPKLRTLQTKIVIVENKPRIYGTNLLTCYLLQLIKTL